jgi:hypothetical protein
MCGLQKLEQTPAVLAVLPHALKSCMPYVSTAVMYLLLISALFAWRELSLGKLRLLIQLGIFAGLAIALVGSGRCDSTRILARGDGFALQASVKREPAGGAAW